MLGKKAQAFLVLSSLLMMSAGSPSYANVESISVSDPFLTDADGKRTTGLKPGQQGEVHVTAHNNESHVQEFAAIFELRSADGLTMNLQWQTATLQPNEVRDIGVGWQANVPEDTEITARAFLVSDVDDPMVLSPVTTGTFEVSDSVVPDVDYDPLNGIAEHTVLVYMVGSDLESAGYAATDDIYEMASADSTTDVNVLVETGGAFASIDDYRFIDFNEVQRHLITKDYYETLENLGQQNMGDPGVLTDFIEWGVSEFPAERYSIILWDHGNGINGFGWDEIFYDDLSLDELETAFADARMSTGTDFDVIGFDACLMATIEVANRLSPYGNYLVASEEFEPAWGWDYAAILSSLAENPTLTGDNFGKIIADSYVQHAKVNAELYEEYESQKTITLSVIDLKKVPALNQQVTLLADNLDREISRIDSSYLFARAIDNTERYGIGARESSSHVDLYHLASNIESEFPELDSLTEDVQQSLSDAVIYNVRGEAKPNANGISVYLPLDVENFNDNSIFYTLNGWDDLLETQQETLESDEEPPEFDLEFDGSTINGTVEGDDVAQVLLFVSSETYDGTRVEVLSYREFEPSSIIELDGSLEFEWNQQIISLCNKEFCAPTLMDLEVSGDTIFALFPVRLEAEDVDEPVTLVYEVSTENNDLGSFEFLGAWPEINEQGTVSRELLPLNPGDKIYTYTYEYDIEDEEYFSYLEYEPIEVDENFQPEYFVYPGAYYLSLAFCDYSDNCSYSEEYPFTIDE